MALAVRTITGKKLAEHRADDKKHLTSHLFAIIIAGQPALPRRCSISGVSWNRATSPATWNIGGRGSRNGNGNGSGARINAHATNHALPVIGYVCPNVYKTTRTARHSKAISRWKRRLEKGVEIFRLPGGPWR